MGSWESGVRISCSWSTQSSLGQLLCKTKPSHAKSLPLFFICLGLTPLHGVSSASAGFFREN